MAKLRPLFSAFFASLLTLLLGGCGVLHLGAPQIPAANTAVLPGNAAALSFSAYSSTQTAGSPFSVTVTVQDSKGSAVTGYTGTVHFTSTDPYPASFPADYTFTASDAGVHIFSGGVTLKTAGTRIVTVTDTSFSALQGSTSGITVGPSPLIASLAWLPAPMPSYTASNSVPMTSFSAEL